MIKDKEKNFISAVVYVRNNEREVEQFFTMLESILKSNFEKYEIIFVNDASSDRSINIIKNIATSFSQDMVQIIHLSFYQGIETAMKAGVDLAIGDFVFEFDTMQVQYDIKLLMEVYKHALSGYDIVNAVPKYTNKTTSRIFYYLFNRYANGRYLLRTETFRILSRRSINRIAALSQTIPYRKAIYAISGLPMDNVEYDNNESDSCFEQQTDRMRREVAVDSLILFTNIASKISQAFSLMMIAFTILIGIYITVLYFSYNTIVTGWTPLMGMMCIGFFGIFSILSVMIKYLSLMLNLIFKKQQYLISSIEKLK